MAEHRAVRNIARFPWVTYLRFNLWDERLFSANEERANITAYLQEIALLTGKCIKFVERSTQPDYIYFYRDTK